MEQLRVPGTLGRLVHLNIVARWDDRYGWDAVIRHKHRMEDVMCKSVDRYEELSAVELTQVLEAVLFSAHWPHTWLSSDPPTCSAEDPEG